MTKALEVKTDVIESLELSSERILLKRRETVVDQLEAAEPHLTAAKVCVDFMNVETVTSLELSALIQFTLRLRQRDKSVHVCNVGPLVGEIFDITRFGRFLEYPRPTSAE